MSIVIGAPRWTTPEGWSTGWRPELDFDTPLGRGVPVLRGWIVGRKACANGSPAAPCCTQMIGQRLDSHQPVWGLSPCPQHRREAALVLDALKTMPERDEELVSLAARLLEEAIAS